MTENVYKVGDKVRYMGTGNGYAHVGLNDVLGKPGVVDSISGMGTPQVKFAKRAYSVGISSKYLTPLREAVHKETRQDRSGQTIVVTWGHVPGDDADHSVQYDSGAVTTLSRGYIEAIYDTVIDSTDELTLEDAVETLRSSGYVDAATFLNDVLSTPKTHKVVVEFEVDYTFDLVKVLTDLEDANEGIRSVDVKED